ncbi:hypothetical protein F5Y15DRAFT_208728 [Xylariaceae sp. FL0016]|nr:hypothetical protein F5Y15DRAFT_208728 [Xylariaceae sp. FL0016]
MPIPHPNDLSLLGLPIAPITLARGTTTALGLLGLTVGVRALLEPRGHCVTFGLGPHHPATVSAPSNPFIYICGARTAVSGLAILGCLALREHRALGVMLVTSVIAGLADGVIVLRYGGWEDGICEGTEGKGMMVRDEQARKEVAWKKAVGHWSLLGIFSVMGAWMIATC